jgi:malonate transporter and related proteins
VLALTLSYPNVAAVGYPLLHGPASGVAVAAGLTIGSITFVPVTLAVLENSTGNRNPNVRAGNGSVVHSIVKALKKPVVWAPVLGIVFALFSIHLAKCLELSLATMGSATTGGALFLTGLVVAAQAFRLERVVILSVLGKNVIQPAFCLLLATDIGMESHQRDYVVLVSAIPCGFFGERTTITNCSSRIGATSTAGLFCHVSWLLCWRETHYR